MQNDPINTIPVQQLIQQVKSADASNAREIKIDIQSAKRLAFTLGEIMSRLNGNLEEILEKKYSREDETIKIELDGGNTW
jgi:hypothetical protein